MTRMQLGTLSTRHVRALPHDHLVRGDHAHPDRLDEVDLRTEDDAGDETDETDEGVGHDQACS